MNQESSPHRYSSPAITAAAIIIIIAGLMQATSIVTPILLALFVSVICAQPVNWLGRKKIPHGLAVAMVLLLIILQQNPQTRWIAVLLGTQEDAQLILDENNKSRPPSA